MKNLIASKLLRVLINSLIAGMIFAVSSAAYLYFANYFGLIILSIGFVLCLLYAYDAYLIKFPYILENNPLYILETVISLFGNVIGSILIAALLYLTPFYDSLPTLEILKTGLIELNHFEVLFYALLNGLLIYFGVNTYKKAEQPIARFLVLILCIVGCGAFMNANIGFTSFFFAATKFNGNLWGKFFTILLGNTAGLILIPLLRKLRGKLA